MSLTPPSSSGGGGGGYTPPITIEVIQMTGTVASGSAPTSLSWAHASGDALLDYTDPTAPTIITAGIYAITGDVGPNAQTPAASAQAYIGLDGRQNLGTLNDLNIAPILDIPSINMALVCYCAEGAVGVLGVQHTAVTDLDFSAGFYLQRIT